MFGSSPRVRGKRLPCRTGGGRRRIIPASAGQTAVRGAWPIARPDHPRECGANAHPHRRPSKQSRIIPASAGQTFSPRFLSLVFADHPRECGANAWWCQSSVGPSGSSPRVRGKPVSLSCDSMPSRIIPASAGQTPCCRRIRFARPDHPRECGANPHAFTTASTGDGSSPRVRGKRRLIAL